MGAANPLQGEVSFETEDGKTYLAVFDIAAICAMEDALDRPAVQITAQVIMGRVGFIRAGLWAALRRHHPDLKIDQVGELMLRIKEKKAFQIVLEGIKAAFPNASDADDDEGEEGEGDAPDPPKAPGEGGTGKAS